jgi:hypothetical protein
MRKPPTLRTHAETEAKVAELRAAGRMPPPGRSHEYVAQRNSNVVHQAFSGIGDCVDLAFAEYAIEFDPSCSCKALRRQLNHTSPEDVQHAIEEFTTRIAANVRHAKGWKGALLKAINWAEPESVKSQIREIVTNCISAKQEIPPAAPSL